MRQTLSQHCTLIKIAVKTVRASGRARRPRNERTLRRDHLKGFLLKAPQAFTDILFLILTSQSYLAANYTNWIQLTLLHLILIHLTLLHLKSC
jgi:hypothetical protein